VATRRKSTSSTITGAVSDLQRRVQYLQNAPRPTRLANQVVTRNAIQPRAVGSDQIALNAITNDQIAADAIERQNIANGAVGTAQLGNSSVTTDKLGPFAVNNDKLADASIASRNMTPNSVANASLQDSSVNFRTVSVDAIGKQNMRDNSVGTNELESNSVTNNELANNSVGQSNLQTNSVGFGQLQGLSVGTSTLQNGAVTRGKIGSGQVGTTQIEDRSVTGAKIATNTILLENINGGTPVGIVENALQGGAGILKSGGGNRDVVLSADFGTGFANVARGNHSHGTFVGTPISSTGGAVTFANHRHQVTVQSTSSSLRYKKNISTHIISDPEKILNLELKKYKYKNSKKMYHQSTNQEWMYGYIAEEVHEMGFDEVLGFDNAGNPDSINYGLVSVILLEVVKKQHKNIKNLKNRLTILEESND
jgi:hypothetical protein